MASKQNKNAVSESSKKATEKSHSNAKRKHSGPFYISPSLFKNKRLKRKRLKYEQIFKSAAANRRKTKTDRRKQNLSALQADVTIDLLSDDDDDGKPMKVNKSHKPATKKGNITAINHVLVYPNHLDLSKVPNNVKLVPLNHIALQSSKKLVNGKRKSRPPKRHAQPTIVNNESIVLTDDSDSEPISAAPPPPQTKKSPTKPVVPPIVDEEVTVSIVPRHSAAGSCAKPSTGQLFPMLPDETTVHTVIANRIYELSLTKLREGLASCGIPEFASEQQKVMANRRKCKVNPPVKPTPEPPVSLKLSSDLSISLISDDDDDDDEEVQRISPEKLLQQQPQLSVQQIPFPVTISTTGTRQGTRRRKLG